LPDTTAPAPDWGSEAVRVFALAVLAAAVLTFRLGHPAYWHDELITLAFTREDWGALFGPLWGADTHRPVYYALQKAWIALAGESRVAVRTLNVLLGVATVPVIFAIAWRMAGRRTAYLATLFLILSPLFVLQSRELRMYPLLNLSAAVAILALLVAVQGHRPGGDGRRRAGAWAVCVLAAATAFYAQSAGLLLAVLMGAAVLVGCAAGWLAWRAFGACLVAGVAYGVAIVPGIAPMLVHVGTTLDSFWIPTPSPGWVWSQVAGSYPYPAWAKPAVLALMVGGAWVLRRNPLALTLMLLIVVGQPLLMTALSFWKPMLIVRAIAWPTLFAAILMGVAVAALQPLALRALVAAAVVAVQALAVGPSFPPTHQITEVDGFAPQFSGFDPARDSLVLGLREHEFNLRWNHPGLERSVIAAFSYGDARPPFEAVMRVPLTPRDAAAAVAIPTERVWILWEHAPMFPIPEADAVRPALEAIAARGTLESSVTHGTVRLDIHRVDTAAGAPAGG
jgi:hypothetical protein